MMTDADEQQLNRIDRTVGTDPDVKRVRRRRHGLRSPPSRFEAGTMELVSDDLEAPCRQTSYSIGKEDVAVSRVPPPSLV